MFYFNFFKYLGQLQTKKPQSFHHNFTVYCVTFDRESFTVPEDNDWSECRSFKSKTFYLKCQVNRLCGHVLSDPGDLQNYRRKNDSAFWRRSAKAPSQRCSNIRRTDVAEIGIGLQTDFVNARINSDAAYRSTRGSIRSNVRPALANDDDGCCSCWPLWRVVRTRFDDVEPVDAVTVDGWNEVEGRQDIPEAFAVVLEKMKIIIQLNLFLNTSKYFWVVGFNTEWYNYAKLDQN